MKVGDFVLNKNDVKGLEERFNKMSKEDLKKARAVTLSVAFLSEMFNELIQSNTIKEFDLSQSDLGMLCVKVLSQFSAISCMQYALRTNDPDLFLNLFKHEFQITINAMGDLAC